MTAKPKMSRDAWVKKLSGSCEGMNEPELVGIIMDWGRGELLLDDAITLANSIHDAQMKRMKP